MSFDDPDGAAQYGVELLQGQRVRLRGLQDADLPVLARWWADPRIAATQMGSVMPTSEAAARTLFLDWSDNRANRGSVGFSVESLGHEPGPVSSRRDGAANPSCTAACATTRS